MPLTSLCDPTADYCKLPEQHNSMTCFPRYRDLEWEGSTSTLMTFGEWAAVDLDSGDEIDVQTAQTAVADVRAAIEILTRAYRRFDRSGLERTAETLDNIIGDLYRLANSTGQHLSEI